MSAASPITDHLDLGLALCSMMRMLSKYVITMSCMCTKMYSDQAASSAQKLRTTCIYIQRSLALPGFALGLSICAQSAIMGSCYYIGA